VGWRRQRAVISFDVEPPQPLVDPLQRFLDAQAPIYETALAELRAGRKRTHWMWFIFPQQAGLGTSAMARRFAIQSTAEAEAYLAHPVLGPRLIACAEALLPHRGTAATTILGEVDALKLRSSMSLFSSVSPTQPVFQAVLVAFFHGGN
jgi:uncharacterized protein (DUF1810 family)